MQEDFEEKQQSTSTLLHQEFETFDNNHSEVNGLGEIQEGERTRRASNPMSLVGSSTSRREHNTAGSALVSARASVKASARATSNNQAQTFNPQNSETNKCGESVKDSIRDSIQAIVSARKIINDHHSSNLTSRGQADKHATSVQGSYIGSTEPAGHNEIVEGIKSNFMHFVKVRSQRKQSEVTALMGRNKFNSEQDKGDATVSMRGDGKIGGDQNKADDNKQFKSNHDQRILIKEQTRSVENIKEDQNQSDKEVIQDLILRSRFANQRFKNTLIASRNSSPERQVQSQQEVQKILNMNNSEVKQSSLDGARPSKEVLLDQLIMVKTDGPVQVLSQNQFTSRHNSLQNIEDGEQISYEAIQEEFERQQKEMKTGRESQRNQEHNEDLECSQQMYETGDVSDVIKSVTVEDKDKKSLTARQSIYQMPDEQNQQLFYDHERNRRVLATCSSLPDSMIRIENGHSNIPQSSSVEELIRINLDYDTAVGTELTDKISLKHDKNELAKKLDEMTNSILNFQKFYGHNSISSDEDLNLIISQQIKFHQDVSQQNNQNQSKKDCKSSQKSPVMTLKQTVKDVNQKPKNLRIKQNGDNTIHAQMLDTSDTSQIVQNLQNRGIKDFNQVEATFRANILDSRKQSMKQDNETSRGFGQQHGHLSQRNGSFYSKVDEERSRSRSISQNSQIQLYQNDKNECNISSEVDIQQKPPQPQCRPSLIPPIRTNNLLQESDRFDKKYFQPMSSSKRNFTTNGSESAFGGVGVHGHVQSSENLTSCLKTTSKHDIEKNLLSKMDDRNRMTPHLGVVSQHQAAHGDDNAHNNNHQLRDKVNFKGLLSQSSSTESLSKRRHTDKVIAQSRKTIEQFEAELRLDIQRRRSQSRDNSYSCRDPNSTGRFEQNRLDASSERVMQSRDQAGRHETGLRRVAVLGSPQNMTNGNTACGTTTNRSLKSMGIESYNHLKEEKDAQLLKANTTLAEIQEKSEHLASQLSLARNKRREVVDNKQELLALKGEVSLLKKSLEQKDLALMSLREQNGEQKKLIEQLKQEVEFLEGQVDQCKDPQLFRKYKEMESLKDKLAHQLSTQNFSMTEKAKDIDMILEQYEHMKRSQLEMVEMNKNLINKHDKEIRELANYISKKEKELETKTAKLSKYSEIIKSFNSQIDMFEEFQKSSQKQIEQLTEKSELFKDLFNKERREKTELITKMRPSLRPLPENLKPDNLYKTQQNRDMKSAKMIAMMQQEDFSGEETLLESQQVTQYEESIVTNHNLEESSSIMNNSGQMIPVKHGRENYASDFAKRTRQTFDDKQPSFGVTQIKQISEPEFQQSSSRTNHQFRGQDRGNNLSSRHRHELKFQIVEENSSAGTQRVLHDSNDRFPSVTNLTHNTYEPEINYFNFLQEKEVVRVRAPSHQEMRKETHSLGSQGCGRKKQATKNIHMNQDYCSIEDQDQSRDEYLSNVRMPRGQSQDSVQDKRRYQKRHGEISRNISPIEFDGESNKQTNYLPIPCRSLNASMDGKIQERLPSIVQPNPNVLRNQAYYTSIPMKRNLNFKKPRAQSSNSHKQKAHNFKPSQMLQSPQGQECQQNQKQTKMVPMSSKDYYDKLRQMQDRLEKARYEIKMNMSQNSRSNSRHSYSGSLPRQQAQIKQRTNYQLNLSGQTPENIQRAVTPNQYLHNYSFNTTDNLNQDNYTPQQKQQLMENTGNIQVYHHKHSVSSQQHGGSEKGGSCHPRARINLITAAKNNYSTNATPNVSHLMNQDLNMLNQSTQEYQNAMDSQASMYQMTSKTWVESKRGSHRGMNASRSQRSMGDSRRASKTTNQVRASSNNGGSFHNFSQHQQQGVKYSSALMRQVKSPHPINLVPQKSSKTQNKDLLRTSQNSSSQGVLFYPNLHTQQSSNKHLSSNNNTPSTTTNPSMKQGRDLNNSAQLAHQHHGATLNMGEESNNVSNHPTQQSSGKRTVGHMVTTTSTGFPKNMANVINTTKHHGSRQHHQQRL